MRFALGTLVVVFLLLGRPGGALEVRIAAIGIVDESAASRVPEVPPETDLVNRFGSIPARGLVVLRVAEETGAAPVRSMLDAARVCSAHGYGMLVYGMIRRTGTSWSADIALFDAEAGTVAARFYAADDTAHYDRLMRDLAGRIVEYFIAADPPGEDARRDPEKNLVGFPLAVGYWTPAGGAWNDVLAGLVAGSLGFRYTPVRPLFVFLSCGWQIAFGLDADYGLGMGQPGYESFALHTVKVRLPVELSVDMGGAGSLGLGLGPLLSIDILAQDRLYSSLYVGVTATPGAGATLEYRWPATDVLSVGLATTVDIAFYTTPLVTVSPRFFVELTPGRAPAGGKP